VQPSLPLLSLLSSLSLALLLLSLLLLSLLLLLLSSGAHCCLQKPTNVGEMEEEGLVASRRSVKTTKDNLMQDFSFSKEENDLTQRLLYSVDGDNFYSNECRNSYLSHGALLHGSCRGCSKTGRGRQQSESNGSSGGRRRATVQGRGVRTTTTVTTRQQRPLPPQRGLSLLFIPVREMGGGE
jgi:hypothetical protein